MKRTNFILAYCLLAVAFSYAQEFPGYGIVNQEEIDLKLCSFDKEANAVVLLHEAYSDNDREHHLITTHHIRIKILNEKGFSAASISIPFYRQDDFEEISAVEGMTINIDKGNKVVSTQLERKSIFTRKTNERIGEVVFTFPGIKAGSIIDYKYCSTMKHYGGLEDWEFQERLPVMSSKYTLIILPNMEFAYRVNKAADVPITVRQETSRGGVYFEMNNIPGLGDEPFIDARRDYLQKVIFQLSAYNKGNSGGNKYMTSWDEVTRELLSAAEFGGQLNKNIPGTDVFIKQVKSMILPEDRMKAVFNYVRDNINWNGLYSKYASGGVKDAWQKKTGNSGEINLLLVNLLREASLDAYPMLVSERFHGRVDSTYPFIDQFNSVFACVIINNIKYYLDATNTSEPPHLTPFNLLNTTAFIVNRKAGGLVNITNDSAQHREYISAILELSDSDILSGTVLVKSYDYARFKKLREYKEDINKFSTSHFILNGTTIDTRELKVTNIENDSLPLDQNCKLYGSLNTAGEYAFLPLNIFTGFETNPFLSDNRFSNINFGFRRSTNLDISIQLPPGYTIDEMPKSLKLTNPDKDIIFIRQLEYDKQNNFLRCMMFLEFKKSLYDQEMYPVIKEVYQKILGYLNEPLVLKKK